MRNRARRGTSLAVVQAALVCTLWAAPRNAWGDTVSIPASRDNSLYEESGDTSNGAGAYLFTGRTAFVGNRRALVRFDAAASIPAGSTVTSATLTMNLSRTGSSSSGTSMSLHRLLADWGEAASDAGEPGGTGAPAQFGDATWTSTFWPDDLWSSSGGDFSALASAAVTIGGTGPYTWGSTSDMVSDVQSWVTAPGGNYGWIVIGKESTLRSAVRLDSRENATPANRPVLQVEFTPPPPTVGTVPDGSSVPGAQLTVQRLPGGDLELDWGASCHLDDDDYEVYEGTLGSFTSHAPLLCTTMGLTSATVTPSPGGTYYFAVPRNATEEGSYGRDSSGNERPEGAARCLPRGIAGCPD